MQLTRKLPSSQQGHLRLSWERALVAGLPTLGFLCLQLLGKALPANPLTSALVLPITSTCRAMRTFSQQRKRTLAPNLKKA